MTRPGLYIIKLIIKSTIKFCVQTIPVEPGHASPRLYGRVIHRCWKSPELGSKDGLK
jgi:hypothetical protein